ncbi:sialic acid-binding Ig-like lectin 10 [Simochromis diagramma]|uniref:sialic acid-binding Ig-like lectin 10 n=1 Tax=Simochromis diagramma TaxID=43689 RepID=UPI001A7F0731|nr:sialic acid-binding Ig-like lectin 10 [Simochromis diagramma]
MLVLIWSAVLFSVTGSDADTGDSEMRNPHCDREYCITLNVRKLTAEAGLCVVIPCSFKTAEAFETQHIVWYKCEASEAGCDRPVMIFHTNKSTDVQPEFEGRVSLIEHVIQNNCSIIINNLKESDSGSYQLRVIGEVNRKTDAFTFIPKVNVSVKGLKQKPTLMIPTLTEGQQATLTCTAPGLCSGSVPQITWTWRGAEGTESYIARNSTDYKTENLTAFTQSHVSTLTFNALAKHHNSNTTCKISFTDKTTTEGSSTLTVNYVKKIKITKDTSVKEGEALNLTCSVESFPPSLIIWSKHSSNTSLHNDTGSATLSMLNMTTKDSGQYICTAKYMNNIVNNTDNKVNVTVIYKRKPQIIGNTTVKLGDVLNLTCSFESFPPALIVWRSTNTNLLTKTDLHNDTGSATLVIQNVTAEHSGQYICATKHLHTTVTSYVNVTVTWFSKIVNGSGCVLQSEVLTCVCISEGFPLPTVRWPFLKNSTDYSVFTTVSNHTVNSTVSLTVKNNGSTTLECVSNNGMGEAEESLTIQKNLPDNNIFRLEYLNVIIVLFTGTVLATIICFLAKNCYRKKQNIQKLRNSDEILEMETHQNKLVYNSQALQDNQTLSSNSGPKEVEYANINFSLLKRNSGWEAAKKQESTKTDYAEIKKVVEEQWGDDAGEEGDILEGQEKNVIMELKQCEPERVEGRDEAVNEM